MPFRIPDLGDSARISSALASFWFGLQEIRQDVDGQREHDGGVLLRRDGVEGLQQNVLLEYDLKLLPDSNLNTCKQRN